MRKLFMAVVMVLVTTSLVAQKKDQFTPEQRATLKTKEMTLALDLSESQQEKVYSLNTKMVEFMKSKKGVRKNENLSSDEKYQHRVEMLDYKISHQEELKKILNNDQYETWKTIQAQRKKKQGQKHCKRKDA